MSKKYTPVGEDEVTEVTPPENHPFPGQVESSSLEEADRKLQESEDRYKRLAAEMDNFRKRMEREKEDLVKYGTERLLREILHIKDNLSLALQHSEGKGDRRPKADLSESPDFKTLREGVALTEKELDKILAKFGLHPVPSVGEVFDPAIHEAIAQEETNREPGMVVREYQKGYLFHERLLRPAKVSVAK